MKNFNYSIHYINDNNKNHNNKNLFTKYAFAVKRTNL